ncbi:MAG: MotA/TolQ/ExbB proton channel family protein [Gammaproteobacteria bacterium]|nr:MotA/TolQ/ExbB proton channel family protein [Gammaproteobacteria bacterium]
MAWKAVPNAQRYVEYAPGLMTSLGIFGTFVGVVIGLLHFDIRPDAIDGSIATLIEGLKTAFLTSVVGLAGAMIFNFADAVWFDRRRQANVETHTVTPSDIHNALTAQTDVLRSMQRAWQAARKIRWSAR